MDNDQQRDTTEETAVRADQQREGWAELTDIEHGDPRAPEWHQQRATEAIADELLDLAHAHLYLAAELSRAIALRANRHRNAVKAAEVLRSFPPEATARLWAALEERTVQVPHLGVTRDETPSGPPNRRHWHGTMAPARHLQPVHGDTHGLRVCTTCGGAAGYFDTVNHVGWWHLGGDGEPIRVVPEHVPTLEG